MEIAATTSGLARIALIRREELDGFVEGLFGKADSLELPERAHRAVEVLSEVRKLWGAMRDLAGDPTKPAIDGLAKAFANARELTRIGEHEIHEAVLSCTRARRQMLRLISVIKPTVH